MLGFLTPGLPQSCSQKNKFWGKISTFSPEILPEAYEVRNEHQIHVVQSHDQIDPRMPYIDNSLGVALQKHPAMIS